MVEQPTRSLVRKLAEVMAEIDRIPKRGRNTYHGYEYVLESDLVEAIRCKLAERHIFLFQSVEEERREGTLTTLKMHYTFVDGDTGETHEVNWVGQGDDKGDKGAYKAATGALKYVLLKHFLVPTGDDPEAETASEGRQESKSPERLADERKSQRGIDALGNKKKPTEATVEPGFSEANPNKEKSAHRSSSRRLEKVASRERVAESYKYGRDSLQLTTDELGGLLAEVRNGVRSTDGMTESELADWRQRMNELAKVKTHSVAVGGR